MACYVVSTAVDARARKERRCDEDLLRTKHGRGRWNVYRCSSSCDCMRRTDRLERHTIHCAGAPCNGADACSLRSEAYSLRLAALVQQWPIRRQAALCLLIRVLRRAPLVLNPNHCRLRPPAAWSCPAVSPWSCPPRPARVSCSVSNPRSSPPRDQPAPSPSPRPWSAGPSIPAT